MLKEEEVKIITQASPSCKEPILNYLQKRDEQYTDELEKIDQMSEKLLDSFDDNIQKIESSFEL